MWTGHYQCVPTNTQQAAVLVHVLDGELQVFNTEVFMHLLFQTTSVYLQRFSIFIKSERHEGKMELNQVTKKENRPFLFLCIRKYRMVMEFKNGDEFPLFS